MLSLEEIAFRVGGAYRLEITSATLAGEEVAIYTLDQRSAPCELRTTMVEPAVSDLAAERLTVERIGIGDRRRRFDVLKAGDRVVVCTHGLSPGGAERQWLYLATGLKRAG